MEGKNKFQIKKVRHKILMNSHVFDSRRKRLIREEHKGEVENKSVFLLNSSNKILCFVERVQRNTRTTNRILKSRVQKMQILLETSETNSFQKESSELK